MSAYLNEDENQVINNEPAGSATMDRARETANAAVETETPKPTYTSDEMLHKFKTGVDYSQSERDAMSDEEWGRYNALADEYYAANPTRKMQMERLNSRLDMAEKLGKMARFVADQTKDDEEFKADHDNAAYSAEFLENSPSSFAKMDDEQALVVANDIKKMYDAASQRRGHWQTFVDALKRGHSGVERMLYQGGSLLFGDGGNTEESRAIQRQSEIDDLSNPQKIGSTSNIRSFGDGLDFVLESFGENLERTGVGIAASTAGAVAGGVPGAIIAGSLGTTMLNAGEAVGDQLDEMEQDENMRFSRGAALGQTAWYSLLDGAFGIVPGIGKVWSKALQAAGKDVSKKAVVEMAKDIASREGLKNFGWNFFKTVGGEALQEPAQSQIGGRARRYLQTGSALTPEERKAREKGESPVWRAIFDEAAGGAAAASILGGLGGAVDSAHASRVQKTFDNMFKVLGREELFNKMDPTTRILVSMRVANDSLRTTDGVFSDEQKAALEAQSNDINNYISELSESGSPTKKAIANSAREYLDILNSQFTQMSTDTASDIARSRGLSSSIDGTMLQNGEHKEYEDGSSANIYTDKTGIQVANKFAADGTDDGWIVANAANRKSPMEPSAFKTPEEAVAYAQKLDLLNQVRDAETASKKNVIETAFRNMYGERAPRLRFVDRPNAVNDTKDALPSGAFASYDPQQNIVRINTDAIENLGQIYTVLGHEKFHEDIAEYLLNEAIGPDGLTDEQSKKLYEAKQKMFGGDKVKGAKEQYAKNPNDYVTYGKTDSDRIARFGEEMVAERASVADLVRQLRSTQRGALSSLAMKVGQAIGLKMANDLGVSPELITQKDVAEEIRHLWQNGYTGIHAEIQLPSETAKEKDGGSINDYLSRQKGGEAVVQPTDVKSESATVEAVQNDNSVDQQTEDYYIDSDNVVNENGYTYIPENIADGYAMRRPDLVRRPASDDGMVMFEKVSDVAETPSETASTASVDTETDNVSSEAPKASEAVSEATVEDGAKTGENTVKNTDDDELLDSILASAETYSSKEAVKVENSLPVVKVGDELTRDDIDEGRVNAENIVKDVDKRNAGLKNWIVDRISDDGRTIYLKPGKTDAQKKAAEIKNPLRGSNGQLRKSFMGKSLYENAKDILSDERHTVESLRRVIDDFREAERRIADSITFKNSGMKSEYERLLDNADRRLGEMENQNRLNRGQASRERAQARRGEMTDTELKEMFKWWKANDPASEVSWLSAFVGDSGKFKGIISRVPRITWAKDSSLTPRVEWENSSQDVIPASEIFNVTLDKNNEPNFTAKETQEARFYSRFLFGMSPSDAVKYAIGVREGRNKAGTFNGLLTERITDIGLSEESARDLEEKYDDSSVIEALLNEYIDAEKSWNLHKQGKETDSEREMRERDEYFRREAERSEREALDAEAAQYLADLSIAEEEWAKSEEYIKKIDELAKSFYENEKASKDEEGQIANVGLNVMFKTAPALGLMFKSAPNMSRDEEKKYVRSLGPKIYDDITGDGANAYAELYRLYRMGEGTKGGIDNWLRHLGVPEGKIDLLADHVWKKVEQTLMPSEKHDKIWHKLSPETIIGNAVVNTVKAWQRGGDALEEKGVSRNVANYDDGIGDDEGEITSKDELISPDTFADIDQTTLYRSEHYRRNQDRAISALSDYRNKMSEDRANLILAWQKAYYIAFERLMDTEDAKGDKARKVRRDILGNLTMRIAADYLGKPVGVYKSEMRDLFAEMRKAEKEGKWDSLRIDGFDVPYTSDELVDMMIADGRDEMAYAVESAEDGIENEAIANAWNKEHRNEIAKLAKTDRKKARKLAKNSSDIRALLSKARSDYGWKDMRSVSGNKTQANIGLDVAENASAQDVKDFATRKLNMGLNEERVAKMVAREFGMDEMRAANAVSQANAARTRGAKRDDVIEHAKKLLSDGMSDEEVVKAISKKYGLSESASNDKVEEAKNRRAKQGDLFAGLEGTVEKKPKLSFWDQVKAINAGIVNGKTDDEIVSGMTDAWTMDEPTARQQIGKARERIAKRAEKAEGIAAAKAAKAEAKAKERADKLAKVKTYKVGDVALIQVNETGEAIPSKWDTDETRRNAYLAVKESIGKDVPMEDVVQTVAETSGLEPLEIGRLYQSMYHGKRASYIGDIRAMTASGMPDEDVVKAAVRTYSISEKAARRELDSAKLAVSTVAKENETKDVIARGIDLSNRFGKGDSLASNESRSKFSEEELAEKDAEYKESQRQISEDREFKVLMDLYDGNLYKVFEELKNRGRDKKRISGVFRRNVEAAEYGEIVKTTDIPLFEDASRNNQQVKSDDRKFVDMVMEGVGGDVVKGFQSLRSRGLTQAKAEKLLREWGRRHMKPVNLSAAKAAAKEDAAKQELFGDLLVSFKTAPKVLAMTDDEKRKDGVLKSYSGMRRYCVDIYGKWGLQHGMIIPESAEKRKTFDRKAAADKGIWAKSLRDAIHTAKINYIYDNSPFAYDRDKGDLTIAEKVVYNDLSWSPVWIHGYEPKSGVKAPLYPGKNGDRLFRKRINEIEEKIDAFQEKEFANARRTSSGSIVTDGQSGRAGRSGGVGDLQRGGRGVGASVRGVGGGVRADNGTRGGADVVRTGVSAPVANSGTITQPTFFKTSPKNARFYNNGTLRGLAYHTKDRNGRDMRGSFAAALGIRRDFKDGVVVTPEMVRKVFYSFRPDAAQKVLFEQFMPFAEELGVSFRLFGKDVGQSGDELAGRVKYYVDAKDDVPTVILHELIHVPTAYAVSSYYNEPASTKVPVSKEMASAIDKLRLLFNENKGWLKDEYGVTNLKEFMAEMSNPSMRDALARRNLWEQIVDFFTDVFNAITGRERIVRGSKAYDDVVKALGDVLANGSQKTFDEFREAADNDPHAETNKKMTVTPSEDAAYMDAVKRGDMETAQRMVREAAAKAMPRTKVVASDGLPKIMYHGTNADTFTSFDTTEDGIERKKNERAWNAEYPNGTMFFISTKNGAKHYGKTQVPVFLNLPYAEIKKVERGDSLVRPIDDEGLAYEFSDLIVTDGVESVACTSNEYAIKSALPATYDENGDLIPLSKRFNPESDNIMFKTRASSEDLRYVFGARASLEAHGVAVPKEAVRPSKRDAELDILADMAIKNDVYREKLVNRAYDGEAMNDQEARELFLIARDQMAGVVSQRDGMNALNGKNMAEAEELSNISLERAITAMMRGFSTAGATLRQAQRGASLDEMRDLGVYLMAEVKATMAKKGIEGEIPQSVKDLVDKQANELAAKNEEINAAQQKIAELMAKAEKADAERAIAEMKAKVAEPFKMSAEAREKLSKKYGFSVSDSSVEAVNALARLAGILPKNVMAKGEGQAITLTDEVRECFGQIVSDADFDFDKAMAFVRDSLGDAYDEVFATYRNEMEAEVLMLGTEPAKATVRTRAERQRKGFVKRHPKGRSVQMPLGLTLGGLQDRLEQERRNCRATMDASSDNDERTRSLGRYLRRFVQVRVAEDSSLTNDAILAAVAEEANRMDPDGAFTIQDAARIVSGAKGFDPATKEAIHSRLSVLKKAMALAREGKFTEAAKIAGVSLRTEAQMLEDMEKSLTNELDRLNRDVADILENPLPDEKESAERVKALQDEIKETVETLRKMRDERTANEKKDSVLRILSDRHRKIAEALAYEKSLKDWETALTPDAERARQRIRRLESENRMMSAELSALRRDANLMRSLQRQIDEFQRRLDENDFEPAQKKSKPRIESYSEEVQKKIRERDQMRKAFKAARDSYQYRKLSKPVQVWKDALDILGETKALVGSMDLSSMFRQGGQLSWAHPLLFAKNFKKTLQVFASEDRAQQVMDEIRARDNAKYYERAGVEFTDWGVNATNADDRFVLNHYRKFTNAKLLKLGIEMSERAFSMYLNLMRADVFDRMAASAANPDLSTWSNNSLKALGNYINVASQRGMIDKQTAIGKAVPFLNNVLWSPRNIISRFQFLKETAKLAMPWADPYGSKELRGLFAKDLLRYFAGVAAAIAFTKTMADLLRGDDEPPEDLELDPRSTNFLQVKMGNTHLDFLSGLKQIIVFGSRIATQKTKNTRGEVSDVKSNTELVGRFLRSKFAPGTGFAYDLATRETFERQDLEWLSLANNKEEKGVLWHALQQVVPLTFIDLYEQASLSGIPRTVITGLGTILGVGVQAYDPYTFKQLSGDYRYYKRLYHEANDPAERERLLEYHPMLKRSGAIEAQLKVVSGIKSTIRKREKANLPVDELKDALEREQKKAINLMAGFKNPGQVD